MEQAPRHGSNLIEEFESDIGLCCVNNTGVGQQTKKGIDLLGRPVSDSPMIESISTKSTVAFTEICRNGARRPNHLIGKRPKRGRHPSRERQGQACGFEGGGMGDEAVVRKRVEHGHLRVVHTPHPVAGAPRVKGDRVGGRP
jgi:hypothetical protein